MGMWVSRSVTSQASSKQGKCCWRLPKHAPWSCLVLHRKSLSLTPLNLAGISSSALMYVVQITLLRHSCFGRKPCSLWMRLMYLLRLCRCCIHTESKSCNVLCKADAACSGLSCIFVVIRFAKVDACLQRKLAHSFILFSFQYFSCEMKRFMFQSGPLQLARRLMA